MRNKSRLRVAMEINNSPSNHRRQNEGRSGYHPTLNSRTSNQTNRQSNSTSNTATIPRQQQQAPTKKAPAKTPVRIIDPTEPPKQPTVSTARPERRLDGSKPKGSSSTSRGKSDSKDQSLFTRIVTGKNERSDTYRRDFIKANPPFLGKWYLCNLCNKIIRIEDMQVDHIYPVSKGGSNSTANLAPLCAPCNRDKSNKVDSRVAQMYIRKYGGKAVGVPLSLAFGATTKVGKLGVKGGLMLGKGVISMGLKGLAMGITAFLASSFKVKLIVIGVIAFILFTQGIITF